MNLQSFVKDKKAAEFEVVGVDVEIAESDGKKIAILRLKTPIPLVQGSQIVTDSASNVSQKMEAYDVEFVRIHEDDFGAEGIEINEDGTGTVKCDLRLDVTRNGDVWLKKQSFRSWARDKANERRNDRSSGILNKMNARKTQAEFKGVDTNVTKPEPVAP